MKYINPGKAILFCLLALFCASSLHAQSGGDPLNLAAEQLVGAYFNALTEGNTSEIKQFIGGELYEERHSSLDNPNYAVMLARLFKNASLYITDSTRLANDRVDVRARIVRGNGEEMRLIFTIEHLLDGSGGAKYKIVNEREL